MNRTTKMLMAVAFIYRIAVEEHIDYRTDWMILERVTDGSTPLSHIASQFVAKNK